MAGILNPVSKPAAMLKTQRAISGKSSLDCMSFVSHSDQIHLSCIKAPRTLLGTVAWGHVKGGPSPLLGSLPKQVVPEHSSGLHAIILVTGRKAWTRCQGGERQRKGGEHGCKSGCNLRPWTFQVPPLPGQRKREEKNLFPFSFFFFFLSIFWSLGKTDKICLFPKRLWSQMW